MKKLRDIDLPEKMNALVLEKLDGNPKVREVQVPEPKMINSPSLCFIVNPF